MRAASAKESLRDLLFPLDGRRFALSAVEGVLFSLMFVIGRQLDTENAIIISPKQAVLFILVAIILTALCYLLNRLIARPRPNDKPSGADAERSKKLALGCAIALGACMLAWFLAFFPGIYWYDAPMWYQEWDSPDTTLTSKWSLPYTWAFHAATRFGLDALGSHEAGLAMFSAIQGAIVFLCALYVIRYMATRFAGKAPAILTTALYALHPLLAILYFSTAQDTIFMALFGVILTHVLEMLDDPSAYWSRPSKPIGFSLAILALCLARNNGLYAIAFMIPFALLYEKRLRKLLLIALVSPMAVYLIYSGPVLHALDVDKSTTLQEMSSIPVQQLGRVYAHEKDSLSDEEIKEIESYIAPEALKTYDEFPSISDALKSNLDVDRISDDPAKFLELYFSLGAKHPKTYLEAMLLTNLGQWHPAKTYPDTRMYHPWIESECATPSIYDSNYFDIESLSLLPQVDSAIQYLYGRHVENFSHILPIALLSKSGLYFWLLLFATGSAILERRPKRFLILAPLLALELTVFLAPVVLFRYIAPIVFCTPHIVVSLFEKNARPSEHEQEHPHADMPHLAHC